MSAAAGAGPRRRGQLWVVATPIGNLGDLTPRAVAVLASAALIVAEDTRSARKLLAASGAATPRLLSCHAHNEQQRVEQVLAALEQGDQVALVSEAGTPGVSDPGARLVAAVAAAGHQLTPLPGASAVATALSVAGFSADRYLFLGFLPRRGRERRELVERAASEPWSVVLFESPHRVLATLAELVELAPERPALVARELTKLHEELLRGTLAELSQRLAEREPRGEYTLVLGPWSPRPAQVSLADAVEEARRLMAEQDLGPSEAARRVAHELGADRRAVYRELVKD